MPKTFYIETFGCQMNVHDSEKVAGTLLRSGYTQVDAPEQADLVLYNTCSIREKAAQKIFTRLNEHKSPRAQWREGVGWVKPQKFGVLGCVAQQEGEAVFEAAPHVSLVAGSASYSKLPELMARLEAGERRVTGLSLNTDQTFDTEFTARDNPFRAYITIIEGCDKHCAYCVVPFTRGEGISVGYCETTPVSSTSPPQCAQRAGKGTSITSSTPSGISRQWARPYFWPAFRPGFRG